MQAFIKRRIAAQRAEQTPDAVISLVTRPQTPRASTPSPADEIRQGPRPQIDPLAKLREKYGQLARMFANPDAFLQRIADKEPGVKRMADTVLANPKIAQGMNASRFDKLTTLRNNAPDTPDEAKFLSWGMSLRTNEIDFVTAMGGMTSSRMKSFVKTSRLVFGGPGALNVGNPVLVKVAKQQIRNQPEGAVARHTYAFATQLGVAKLSPTQRARSFMTMAAAVRQKEDMDDIREDLFKDNISGEEKMRPTEEALRVDSDPFKIPESDDAPRMTA